MPKAPTYGERWPTYASWWDQAKIRPQQAKEITATVQRLRKNESRYRNLEKITGVPWRLIAALHERESGARFDRQLAQGDRLDRRSTNEPISGPFKTFEDSAVWALKHDHLDTVIDWRLEKMLYYAELWNGWGYFWYHKATPSPYIVGGTSIQKSGKYVRDGVWSSTAWDEQVGVMALLMEFQRQDPSTKYVRETPEGTPNDVEKPAAPPVPQKVIAAQPATHPVVTQNYAPAKDPVNVGVLAQLWGWIRSRL